MNIKKRTRDEFIALRIELPLPMDEASVREALAAVEGFAAMLRSYLATKTPSDSERSR